MNLSRRIKRIEKQAFHEQEMTFEEILEYLKDPSLGKDIKLPASFIEWLDSIEEKVCDQGEQVAWRR